MGHSMPPHWVGVLALCFQPTESMTVPMVLVSQTSPPCDGWTMSSFCGLEPVFQTEPPGMVVQYVAMLAVS